jgi:hypothetical protein
MPLRHSMRERSGVVQFESYSISCSAYLLKRPPENSTDALAGAVAALQIRVHKLACRVLSGGRNEAGGK